MMSDANVVPTIAVTTIALVAFGGFFWTKTPGFGRFATSTLLLIYVLSLAAVCFTAGQISDAAFVNVLLTTIGFAGGLFATKE